MLLLQQMNAIVDFSCLAVGLRGSGCTCEDRTQTSITLPQYDACIRSSHQMFSQPWQPADPLTLWNYSVEKQACQKKGRITRTGPVVDVVYGFDLSPKKERHKWIQYLQSSRPKVWITEPPCTHVGSFANLNSRYPGVSEGHEARNDLADFATDIALIQLHELRDFIAENPQACKCWKLVARQKVLSHNRNVPFFRDWCMSGFTIPDMHNDGIPILARKSSICSKPMAFHSVSRCSM